MRGPDITRVPVRFLGEGPRLSANEQCDHGSPLAARLTTLLCTRKVHPAPALILLSNPTDWNSALTTHARRGRATCVSTCAILWTSKASSWHTCPTGYSRCPGQDSQACSAVRVCSGTEHIRPPPVTRAPGSSALSAPEAQGRPALTMGPHPTPSRLPRYMVRKVC